MYLHDINLYEIPHEISSLEKLTFLETSCCRITKISQKICKLTNLRHLQLHHNPIKTFSPEICCLPKLEKLGFVGNPLIRIPHEINKLSNLTFLDVNFVKITFLPVSLFQMPGSRTIWCETHNFESMTINKNTHRWFALTERKMRTLKELAADAILHFQVRYNNSILINDLIEYLDENKVMCDNCGAECLSITEDKAQLFCIKHVGEWITVIRRRCYFCPLYKQIDYWTNRKLMTETNTIIKRDCHIF